MTARAAGSAVVQLRAFRNADLPALVEFWNRAFEDRRNFRPMTADGFRRRVLECPAFDASGLILAWHPTPDGHETIIGIVHAFRPPPHTVAYVRWGRHHSVALLYVGPEFRRQGIGSRLLRTAENWLYYCPVHFAGQSVPCYGGVEGPRPPFFGSTQRMGVNAHDAELVHFLANRGYAVVEPGDVSMSADLQRRPPGKPPRDGLEPQGLRLVRADHTAPFRGREPADRLEYASWGHNDEFPHAAVILADHANMLRGHLCWYPLPAGSGTHATAGIYAFWLAPDLRGQGLGSLLLDTALDDMTKPSQMGGPFRRVEVQTHVVRHIEAVALYESRGFQIDDAWVSLVKT